MISKSFFKLTPNVFTPLSRTPWAGETLAKSYKQRWATPKGIQQIGEAWDFSCSRDFHSMLVDLDMELGQFAKKYPHKMFGKTGVESCDLLVKWLNAKSPLSLQLHPADDYSLLLPHECGKPESWLVLASEADGCIYLGFKRQLSQSDLLECLRSGAKPDDFMQRVAVEFGDYFEIEPGVPHAVGPGVVLLEPQRVLPGKSGKTYRMSDWGRRYNASGQLDPNGSPRELHIDESLPLLSLEYQWGEQYVESLKCKPQYRHHGDIRESVYPANSYYQTRLFVSGSVRRKITMETNCYACMIQISGQSVVVGEELNPGEPALITASEGDVLDIDIAADSSFALFHPTQCQPLIHQR